MKVNEGEVAMPGDVLGVSEQFMTDQWTYEENGYIKAAVMGEVAIDNKNKKIDIIPKSSVPTVLKRGDLVFGQITDVRGQRALVNVEALKDSKRSLAFSYMGAIHISQAQKGYLDRLTEAFRIGDIIQASVAKVTGDSLDLGTSNNEEGVLKAMCTRCRTFMIPYERNILICPNCENKEKRKISSNYDY